MRDVVRKLCEGVTDPEELIKEIHSRITNRHGRETILASGNTHGNIFLRKTIIECAWGASRTKDCFFSRFSFHQTQVRKKNKMKVLVAVARKLLIAIWHVLHDETDYKDFSAKNDCETSVSESNG